MRGTFVNSTMIFKEWGPKYFECGIPVIPLSGKIPLVKNWERWASKEQTEDELEWLIARFANANIGAVMGRWACALDIDTDDPEILSAIPYSPLKRRGEKGQISLYAPCALQNDPGSKVPVELLNVGRQIVLPPSIHPRTKEPYVWTGLDDVLRFNMRELPVITQAQIDQIVKLCTKRSVMRAPRKYTAAEGDMSAAFSDLGRNNRLSAMAYAMACDSVPVNDAVERILAFDKKEHDTPWFSDPTEPHAGKNPAGAAKRMLERAMKKATERGDVRPVAVMTYEDIVPTKPPTAGVPQPRGLMRLFQDYCNLTSFGDQDALGLGGAISMMAALASNRFRTQSGAFTVWPNMYVINLAHSGFGKETPQRALDEILIGTDLVGSATYKSGSSIVMGLPEQPARLDVIDECAMLLKAMAAREDYKADIVDVLSTLYSKSNTFFHGFTSKGDGKNFGACWNPCVNILGSTTPAGFKSSVSKDMAAKGLLPRFLIFWQQDVGEFKRKVDAERAERLLGEIKRLSRQILSFSRREHPESRQKNLLDPKAEELVRYDPELVPMSDGAQRAIIDIQEQYFNEGKENPESFESAFKNRFAQHTAKLALLDALSMGLAEISTDQVSWAHSVVKWQWETVRGLYELASAENDQQKDVLKVMQYIKSAGTVSRADLMRRFTSVHKLRLDGIIKQLEDGECIQKGQGESTGGRRPTLYRYVKDIF